MPSRGRPSQKLCFLGILAVSANGMVVDKRIHPRLQTKANPNQQQPGPSVEPETLPKGKCPFTTAKRLFGIEAPPSGSWDVTASFPTNVADIHQTRVTAVDQITPSSRQVIDQIDDMYEKALTLKCPFFRRRAADILDTVDAAVRSVVDTTGLQPSPSLRCKGKACEKSFGLSTIEVMEAIRKDWKQDTNRGYYVTGRLSTNIYRDDCLFDGPDPDMPVKGLRKYLNAACQLFDQKKTRSELLSLEIDHDGNIVAQWRFNGVLRLPWRPLVPQVTGRTTYCTDNTGLIYKHVETWDISAVHAFLYTFLPQLTLTLQNSRKRLDPFYNLRTLYIEPAV